MNKTCSGCNFEFFNFLFFLIGSCPVFADEDAIKVEEATLDPNYVEDKQGSKTGIILNRFSIIFLFQFFFLSHMFSCEIYNFSRVSLFPTDSNAVKREEEAIKIDELNVAQIKELRDKVRLTKFILL